MSNKLEPITSEWEPKTKLGRLVKEGKIVSIYDIFYSNYTIKEPEIVRFLVPNLEYEILEVRLVQKMTDAGRRTKFRAIVAVGNREGIIGLGTDKAKQVQQAIQKAINKALLNVTPVKRGCGSWECGCNASHSIIAKTEGQYGSVKVILYPAPQGTGIVAGGVARTVISLAGIKDVRVIAFGKTRTAMSFAGAVYDALRNTYKLITKEAW